MVGVVCALSGGVSANALTTDDRPGWAGGFVLCGYVLDAPEWGVLRGIEQGAVAVSQGKIVAAGPVDAVRAVVADWPESAWLAAPAGERWLVLPGLVDVHAHLPQYPVVARVEKELLPWLKRHIFPTEAAYTGGRLGLQEEMEAFFAEIAANGTTTAMLYGAVWRDSTDMAFAAAAKSGLRILMGKVMMDVDSYGHGAKWPAERTREVSLEETRGLITKWHGHDAGRLEYVVSPRFAVTCSRELMSGAAALAAEFGCAVQTHLSENLAEIDYVRTLFPEAASYTDVYAKTGLLGPRSVYGHCVHLSPEELDLMAQSRSTVAHCPTSNFFLNSGLCPVDQIRAAGVRIGLGSDVAGGPELNLWQVMRSAIETQKARRFYDPDVPELNPAQALYLATAGGADVAGQGKVTGSLTPGLEADLTVFDLNAVLPMQGRFTAPDPSPEAVAALMIYRGGPHALRGAWVRGRKI
jgi:guanine deaminase